MKNNSNGLERTYYDSLKTTKSLIEDNIEELNEAQSVAEVMALGKTHKGKWDRASKVMIKLINKERMAHTLNLIRVNEEITKIERGFEKNDLDN